MNKLLKIFIYVCSFIMLIMIVFYLKVKNISLIGKRYIDRKTERLITIENIRTIFHYAAEYREKHNEWPDNSPLPRKMSSYAFDGWNKTIRMSELSTDTLRLHSFGKDGFRHTKDDIIIDLYYDGNKFEYVNTKWR